MNAAIEKLEAAGVAVDRSARPNFDPAPAVGLGLWLVSAALTQSMPAATPDQAGADSGLAGVTHREWLDRHAAREGIRAAWAEFFDRFDLILMPVSCIPPFPHNQDGEFGNRTLECNGQTRAYIDLVLWTILTGMAYLPVSVPPLGLDEDGLPIGLQVVGPYGGDLTTIRMAGLIAELCGGYQAPPIA